MLCRNQSTAAVFYWLWENTIIATQTIVSVNQSSHGKIPYVEEIFALFPKYRLTHLATRCNPVKSTVYIFQCLAQFSSPSKWGGHHHLDICHRHSPKSDTLSIFPSSRLIAVTLKSFHIYFCLRCLSGFPVEQSERFKDAPTLWFLCQNDSTCEWRMRAPVAGSRSSVLSPRDYRFCSPASVGSSWTCWSNPYWQCDLPLSY